MAPELDCGRTGDGPQVSGLPMRQVSRTLSGLMWWNEGSREGG